jgi:hypothetical protein
MNIELYDDLLELAHSLTYYQRSISPQMWQFFEQLFQLFKGTGVDFVEGIMIAIVTSIIVSLAYSA